MKLKIKLPLLFSLIILILSALIAVYIKTSVIDSIIGNIIDFRDQMDKKNEGVSLRAEELYPNFAAMENYLQALAQEERISLTLYDSEFQKMKEFSGGPRLENPGERWYPIHDEDGRVVMLIQITRSLHSEDIILKTAFTKTFIFLLFLLSVIFILLTIYLHYFITKPIQKLNRRLGKIKVTHIPVHLTVNRKDEIGELYKHVLDMEERLQQSNKDQVNMVAAITHDIKTPLTSIKGFIELLLTKPALTEKDKTDYLHLIEKKADHLTELMIEFSSYTKNELLLPSITFQPVKIKAFFESIAIEYEAELSGLDYDLDWEHSFKGHEIIQIHEPMLRRVFANLISNAVRYGSTDKLHIDMRGYIRNGNVVFVIEDNGIGVPVQHMDSLFQRFFTVDQSRQSKEGGTGLGLASCKSIIERHGGEIEAFQSAGGGLGIVICIPQESE
ncbi:HAMP domain-containing histidine kinase [Paenibacillus sp. 7124]|uniref:histidine kinase n=1 Tax=Paenibacillus apii TaxID=1850370 RepID=A0A6M1PTA3_9BACL|nr:HAMP domain-containing sensor histidine kinase [Paenibacillus apii]NGM85272.1 HAMP domain-containing histidine kinase [Paenibacillus apii]NJJ41855.1 HAMP domain-containing histidine kinase [Paenibacillus apii]